MQIMMGLFVVQSHAVTEVDLGGKTRQKPVSPKHAIPEVTVTD
jgi:hypothetical protein